MVTVAVLGMVSTYLLTWLERWLMPWNRR